MQRNQDVVVAEREWQLLAEKRRKEEKKALARGLIWGARNRFGQLDCMHQHFLQTGIYQEVQVRMEKEGKRWTQQLSEKPREEEAREKVAANVTDTREEDRQLWQLLKEEVDFVVVNVCNVSFLRTQFVDGRCDLEIQSHIFMHFHSIS